MNANYVRVEIPHVECVPMQVTVTGTDTQPIIFYQCKYCAKPMEAQQTGEGV